MAPTTSSAIPLERPHDLADLRVGGLVEDQEGRPVSLDDRVLPDLDAALGALRAAGLRAHLVLT
ncbi:MAG: hypothetical protein ACHP85_26960, partial [Burkholderiales bacterium]